MTIEKIICPHTSDQVFVKFDDAGNSIATMCADLATCAGYNERVCKWTKKECDYSSWKSFK